MTAPPDDPMPALPDPHDPANQLWWQAHDRLHALAEHALSVARVATAAYLDFRQGRHLRLDVLVAEVDRWCWNSPSLDVIDDYHNTRRDDLGTVAR